MIWNIHHRLNWIFLLSLRISQKSYGTTWAKISYPAFFEAELPSLENRLCSGGILSQYLFSSDCNFIAWNLMESILMNSARCDTENNFPPLRRHPPSSVLPLPPPAPSYGDKKGGFTVMHAIPTDKRSTHIVTGETGDCWEKKDECRAM